MRVVETLALLAVFAGLSVQENVSSNKSPIPGSPKKVSNDDPRVQNAALIGIYTFNNQSSDKFLFRVSSITDAHIQIVKGIKYLLEANISRTICQKSTPNPNLDECHFQPRGKLHQVLGCYFQVLTVPWEHWMKTTFFVCHP